MKKLLPLLMMLICFVSGAKTLEPLKSYEAKEIVSLLDQDGRQKTVHVKSYTRKNGTVVKAHMRRAPKRH